MASERPNFIKLGLEEIRLAIVADLEAATEAPLDPASPEALLVSRFAYREWVLRQQFQAAIEQSFIAFCGEEALALRGEERGVERLPAQAAKTDLGWVLQAEHPGLTLPAGTRIGSDDGAVTFVLPEDLVVGAGQTSATAEGLCDTEGEAGNGYTAGRVATLLDPKAFVVSVANTNTTGGGAAEEDLEAWRQRVMLAPLRLPKAGPKSAYKQLALGAHPDVVDVAVLNPSPGTVRVVVLVREGADEAGALAEVEAALDQDEQVPLCDTVEVVAASPVDWSWAAALTWFASADTTTGMAEAQAVAEQTAAQLAKALGRRPVPSALVAVLQREGVFEVQLTAPLVAPAVGADEWARCTGITLTLAGVVDG